MSNTIELERTFLAKYIPKEILGINPVKMKDVYVPESLDVHSRLRVRMKGDKYEITKKTLLGEGDASRQMENTIDLSSDEYLALEKTSKKSIEKHRFSTSYQGVIMEVDVFLGELLGLVLIDFEFSSIGEMEEFAKPEFCLADITQETFIAGGVLAGKNYDQINEQLMRFEYKKIVHHETGL